MKYYSIGEFADKIGKTIQTLRNNVRTYMIAKDYQFEIITDIGN